MFCFALLGMIWKLTRICCSIQLVALQDHIVQGDVVGELQTDMAHFFQFTSHQYTMMMWAWLTQRQYTDWIKLKMLKQTRSHECCRVLQNIWVHKVPQKHTLASSCHSSKGKLSGKSLKAALIESNWGMERLLLCGFFSLFLGLLPPELKVSKNSEHWEMVCNCIKTQEPQNWVHDGSWSSLQQLSKTVFLLIFAADVSLWFL